METQPKPLALTARPRSYVFLALRRENIYLVVGTDLSGRKAWYYLHVQMAKKQLFESQTGNVHLNLLDFGTILMSGFGDRPPLDAIQQARHEFGFESI